MEALNLLVEGIGTIIQFVGVGVVVIAVALAISQLPQKQYKREKVRSELAKNVIFGLEFIIAADILIVTVATNFDDILQLGGIVLIRVVMGYALKKENIR